MLGFIHKAVNLQITEYCTAGENIIATIKMRNNFCYPLKQFWAFLYCSPFSDGKSCRSYSLFSNFV